MGKKWFCLTTFILMIVIGLQGFAQDLEADQIKAIIEDFRSELPSIAAKLGDLSGRQATLLNRINRFTVGSNLRMVIKDIQATGPGVQLEDGAFVSGKNYDGFSISFDPIESGDQSRGTKAYLDGRMRFDLRPHNQMLISVNLNVGSIWGGSRKYGLENVQIITNYHGVRTTFGTFAAKLTPFTLYYPLQTSPFEAKVFQDERQFVLTEEQLNHQRKLTGALFETEKGELSLKAVAARVAPTTKQRYLLGIQGTDYLSADTTIGFSYLKLFDAYSFAAASGQAEDNSIAGINFAKRLGSLAEISGEFVQSAYDDNALNYDPASRVPALRDYASKYELKTQLGGVELAAGYVKTGPYFRAIPVQAQDYTLQDPTLASSQWRIAPFGPATANRQGWQGEATVNLLSVAKLSLSGKRASQLLPTDKEEVVTTSHQQLAQFQEQGLGLTLSLGSLLQNIVPWDLGSVKNLDFTCSFREEKAVREDDPATGTDETITQSSFGSDWGLVWNPLLRWEVSFGHKTVESTGSAKEAWGVYALNIGYSLDENSRLVLRQKLIDYTNGTTASADFFARPTLIELQTNF